MLLVKDLIEVCFDKIVIYTPLDNDMMNFKDLYKGDCYNVPSDLMYLNVRCFGSSRKGIIEISVRL